jgi:hypothetical protein
MGAGVGGITRGGSSTGLLWGRESETDASRFETKRLSSAQFLDLQHSAAVGVAADAPEAAPVGEGAGLVDVEGSTGEASWRRRLSPRHRDAVSTFFSNRKRE